MVSFVKFFENFKYNKCPVNARQDFFFQFFYEKPKFLYIQIFKF